MFLVSEEKYTEEISNDYIDENDSLTILEEKLDYVYKNIELTYYNENGEKIVKKLNGFFARLVQHECDHLDGIVFLEKVKGPNGFATKENIDKYNLREVN